MEFQRIFDDKNFDQILLMTLIIFNLGSTQLNDHRWVCRSYYHYYWKLEERNPWRILPNSCFS